MTYVLNFILEPINPIAKINEKSHGATWQVNTYPISLFIINYTHSIFALSILCLRKEFSSDHEYTYGAEVELSQVEAYSYP